MDQDSECFDHRFSVTNDRATANELCRQCCRMLPEDTVDIKGLCPDTLECDAGSRMDITPTVLTSSLKILNHLEIVVRVLSYTFTEGRSQTYGKDSHKFLFTVALSRPGIIVNYLADRRIEAGS